MEQICEQVMVTCPEGCGEKHLRGKVTAIITALLDDQALCYKGVEQDQILCDSLSCSSCCQIIFRC